MGYYIELMESSFMILKENQDAALTAIKALAGKETIKDSSGMHFSWVNTENFLKAKTIHDALKEWHWETQVNQKGDIFDLYFTGEKLGDDNVLFDAIAPYVEDGYIQMKGEDDYVWRWIFKGGQMRELPGTVTITFPE